MQECGDRTETDEWSGGSVSGDLFLLWFRVTHSIHSFGRRVVDASRPLVWGWQRLGRLYPDVRVPFSRGEDDDLIQELFNACQQVLSVLGFVGNIMEDLPGKNKQLCESANPLSVDGELMTWWGDLLGKRVGSDIASRGRWLKNTNTVWTQETAVTWRPRG